MLRLEGHGGKEARRKTKKRVFKKKLSGFTGKALFFAFAILAVSWLGLQAFNYCMLHAIKTVEVQTGELSALAEAEGVLLLEEEVVRAPVTGTLEPLASEGERLPIGSTVARLQPLTGPDEQSGGSLEIKSPSTGIVCYHLDGWEGVYDRLAWERSDPGEIFENITGESKREGDDSNGDQIGKGAPLFKIIDNLVDPYLIIRYKTEHVPHLKTGERLQLTWGEEGTGSGKVISLANKEDNGYALVELKQAHPFPCSRFLEMRIKSKKGDGVIVPVSALVEEDNQKGVYVMSVVSPVFKKVDVVAVVDDQAAVQGISPGTEVVKNPSIARLIKKDKR